MNDFVTTGSHKSLTVKLWRGERMCLIGMDVSEPEDDFVGFSIESKAPGEANFKALCNRLAFAYPTEATHAVTGGRNFSSINAPFQKFRWMHFPSQVKDGTYTYRVTKQHMPQDGTVQPGDSVTLGLSLDAVIYNGFLDLGFTRGFASSQAYADEFENNANVIPASGASGLSFDKSKSPAGVYEWLGFEAYDLIFGLLNEVASDPSLTMDAFIYDFDEPDILALLLTMKGRLRAILDDSGTHKPATSDPSLAAAQLAASAGAANVIRMHFHSLQHNKVFVVKKNGVPYKVLHGSTNFSFRGLYIQNNNCLVFTDPEIAKLFSDYFDAAFTLGKANFATNPISKAWHPFATGHPSVQFCLSPHTSSDLSLNPVANAMNNATSSVFFSIAFLYQSGGPVREAADALIHKPLFSYGISDKDGSMDVLKPDGTLGTVDFAYLAKKTPEPFASEWSGGSGINEHNKFVVVDFNTPDAKVFTGSSNLSPAGETGNGDNLVLIEDQRVAASFALEALRVFDHLQFRVKMQSASKLATKAAQQTALTLQKPVAISGAAKSWFASFYVTGSQAENDRKLFSS